MSYKFLEDVATGDVAFKATGKNLLELFASAAEATSESMVDTSTVAPKIEKQVTLEAKKPEDLLYDFLGEIVYLKDAEQMLFSDFSVEILESSDTLSLKATLKGEKIDKNKHKLKEDLKSVTYHKLKIAQAEKGYSATVILDI